MRFANYCIVFVFLALILQPGLCQHYNCYNPKKASETSCNSKKAPLASQAAFHCTAPNQSFEPFASAATSPQCWTHLQPEVLRPLRCQDGSTNKACKDFMALPRMLEAMQRGGREAQTVWRPLVSCARSFVCAQASLAAATANNTDPKAISRHEFLDLGPMAHGDHDTYNIATTTKIYAEACQREGQEEWCSASSATTSYLKPFQPECESDLTLCNSNGGSIHSSNIFSDTLASGREGQFCQCAQTEQTELGSADGSRNVGSFEELLPRRLQSSAQNPGAHRESRTGCCHSMAREHEYRDGKIGQCQESSRLSQRGKRATQAQLAQPSGKEHSDLENAHGRFSTATTAFRYSHCPIQKGHKRSWRHYTMSDLNKDKNEDKDSIARAPGMTDEEKIQQEEELRAQVQATLQECTDLTKDSETIEIDEDDVQGPKKRQRSVEANVDGHGS